VQQKPRTLWYRNTELAARLVNTWMSVTAVSKRTMLTANKGDHYTKVGA
jgi:hypothetical protein